MGENTAERTITRRKFLEFAVKGTISAALAVKGLEQVFYRSLISGLASPDTNDKAATAALRISESAPNSENPDYRPMTEIIKEGISDYQKQTGKSVFFQRIKEYKGPEYYAGVIKRFALSGLIPQSPNKIVSKLIYSLPGEALAAHSQSSIKIESFDQLYTDGTGFESRYKERHSGSRSEEGKLEINELRRRIEDKSKETGEPVSASFVLSHFLGKNNGDLSHSIFDTAVFLKFMARNDPESGNYLPSDVVNVVWYRQNIKDEYQGPSYNFPPKNETAINLIGKPYHSWNLVAMLQFVPVEVIRVGGVQKQILNFKEQGLGKLRSDLQTLKDLRETEKLLLSYSRFLHS